MSRTLYGAAQFAPNTSTKLNRTICSDIQIPQQGGPWKHICSRLLKHPLSRSLITSKIRKMVGNGDDTLFWHDVWVGDSPLKRVCPRLYMLMLSTSQDASVSSYGFWDGKQWKWSFFWRRELRPRDLVERSLLLQALENTALSPLDSDSFIWSPCKNGSFTVKSFVLELEKSEENCPKDVIKGIWQGLVPHRIEIFTWLALLDKLNTRDKLARIGILQHSEAICVLCNEHPETCSHLFLHCTVTWNLWSWWLNLWGLHWVPPSSPRDAFEQWQPPATNSFFKKAWTFVIMWTIWKERNSRCFENKLCSLAKLQELILLRLSWWIKGWDDSFPYSTNDVLRNPTCIKWNPNPSLISNPPSWLPPPHSVLKWNVDVSLNQFISKSAIGGVLRDHTGKFLCLFSSPIPLMEINHAEIFAIQRALKITLHSNMLQNNSLIVESDSANAVKWCNGIIKGPWNLSFTINFIRSLIRNGPEIHIVYKGRETNVVADC